MERVMRVALPGYNALTDTDQDHFSLYTDEDNVLIKEYTRGSIVVNHGDIENITHNLGYVPFFIVMVYDERSGIYGEDKWKLVSFFTSDAMLPPYFAQSNTTRLQIANFSGGVATFKYYIFYDQQK